MSFIRVNIADQALYLMDDKKQVVKTYSVSTSKYGVGNQSGSEKTPLGRHRIAQKIGAGKPAFEVFVARQPQGILQDLQEQGRELPDDLITSRILWLAGKEKGRNEGGEVDSHARYIYIHGTNEENKIGTPASIGCIRMLNKDIIDLFELVDEGSEVEIVE